MEDQRNRWVNAVFATLSGIVGYLIYLGLEYAAAVFDLETRVPQIEIVVPGVSFLIGLLTFAAFYWNDKANQYTHEAIAELERVTWPSRQETTKSTWVVLLFVVVAGMLFGLLDAAWSRVMQLIF